MQETSEEKAEGPQLNGVQSIERAFDLLECLARSSGWLGISELSATTGQPVATVHRLLRTLIARAYVTRDSRTRRYSLGPAFHRLLNTTFQTPNWHELATPFLRELVEVSGETANLAVMERDKAVYVAQAQSIRMVRMFTELGNRVPLHNTGCGKILLAFQSESVIDTIIAEAGLPAYTDKTITDPEQFRVELTHIRREGYAIDNGEQEEGVRCISVPLYGIGGKVVAALSISGPASRLDDTKTSLFVPHLKRVSSELSSTLTAVS
ncbi:MAG: allantoin degradation transcriptional regulator AllR [Ktedonobacteraceae bacterium]